MSEKLKEALSAVIDGEADEFELRRVLDEIGKNPELAGSWERYHLIGAVMRRERISRSFGMRELVWAEVGLEGGIPDKAPAMPPEPEAKVAGVSRHTGRWVSLGVAATVALAVGIGYFGVGDLGESAAPVVAGTVSEPSGLSAVGDEVGLTLTSEITPVDQARTEAYVIRHLQQLGMNRTGIGFAKMVAYERE